MTARNGASRRQMLRVAGVSASGVALVAVLGRDRARAPNVEQAKAAAPIAPARAAVEASFLADLRGRTLGGYTVEEVGAIERGGAPVIMATSSGEKFRVDVLRADPFGPSGIGVASLYAVFLRNGGDGRTATDEQRGIGAMALAKELARRSRKGEKPPALLLTMSERSALDAVS